MTSGNERGKRQPKNIHIAGKNMFCELNCDYRTVTLQYKYLFKLDMPHDTVLLPYQSLVNYYKSTCKHINFIPLFLTCSVRAVPGFIGTA